MAYLSGRYPNPTPKPGGRQQQLAQTAGPVDDQTEEEKRRKRLQQGAGRAPGQQAPWATPGSSAVTTGGPSRNPFASSVYARPAQTMQGPTVATFSARPQAPQDQGSLPLWRKLTAGSTPGAPGGTTGGMFAPTFSAPGGGPGGGGPQGPVSQFMQTIPIGGPPKLPTPAAPPGGGMAMPPGVPANIPLPGGGNIPLSGGNLGNVLGAILPSQPGGGTPWNPPKQGGSTSGNKPYEAPEPGSPGFVPPGGGAPAPGGGGPVPPVASLLPPPPMQGPPPGIPTGGYTAPGGGMQGPPPGNYGLGPTQGNVAPGGGYQSAYQQPSGPAPAGTPAPKRGGVYYDAQGTPYAFGPNGPPPGASRVVYY
jgi:hypothetical protein